MVKEPLADSTLLTSPRVTAICTDGSGVEVVHRNLSEHIPNYNLITLNRYIASIAKAAAAIPVDSQIVHTTPELAAGLNSRNKKILITFHGFSLDFAFTPQATLSQSLYYRTILYRTIVKSIRQSTKITTVSKYLSKLISDYFGLSKMPLAIPNGIDTSKFTPSQRENDLPVVLFSGNPHKRKGVELIYEVASALQGIAKIHCTSGIRRNKSLIPHSNIEFIPRTPHGDMPFVYQNADILFLPSLREGFGMAILEAMSCGLPVVATNCSAIPELVTEGKGGELFQPNAVNEAVEKLIQLIKSKSMREEYGIFNRERSINRYEIKNIGQQYRDLFSCL